MSGDARVAIVTGGAQGIGLGITLALVQSGYTVVVADRDVSQQDHVAQAVAAAGGSHRFIATDVSHEASVQRMIDTVSHAYGGIDLLVNNAGVTVFKPLAQLTVKEWDDLFGIDMRGVFLCSKAVIPVMEAQQKGVIVNISSNHALATLSHSEAYTAAKSGIIGFTRSLALSYGHRGIRALTVCPGFTDTPHYRRWLAGHLDAQEAERKTILLHPVGRIVQPGDVGKLVRFLASDDASMLTGTEIVIDGGVSARLYNDGSARGHCSG